MKRLITLTLILLGGVGLSAQVTIEREVIGSLGQFFTGSDLQISATAGEAAVTTLSAPDLILTQGFQQAEAEDVSSVQIVSTLLSNLSVYPNPASEAFWIRVAVPQTQELQFEVLNATGQRLESLSQRIPAGAETTVRFNIERWPAGIYLVRLITEKGRLAGTARLVRAGN